MVQLYQIAASSNSKYRGLYQIDFYIRYGNTGLEVAMSRRMLAREVFSAFNKLAIFNEKNHFFGHLLSSSPVNNLNNYIKGIAIDSFDTFSIYHLNDILA